MFKTCCKCKTLKDTEEFSRDRSTKDGLSARCRECDKAKSKKRYHQNKLMYKEASRKWWINQKIKVLTHYGRGKLACVSCGEEDIRCLSIDHIFDNGAAHRKEEGIKIKGARLYIWLLKEGFPEGYQTLCMNCQWKKRFKAP